MTNENEFNAKCIKLKGELEDWGKHILMLPMGVTLCGCITVDANKEMFPILEKDTFQNMFNEYTVEEWEITCEKCLDMVDVFDQINENKVKSN